MEKPVLSISQLNEYIKERLSSDRFLSNIAVRGEISNYKRNASGHVFFTLKDENSVLPCTMYKNNALRLRFEPNNGMTVIVTGYIAVYVRDGHYRLYCNTMTVDGVGDLHVAFEQLKQRLDAQGLFDPAHKKPIPRYPGTIGIVTSSTGAAVHDMLRILNKRYPLTTVKLLPVRVQGAEAPAEIAAAIDYANHYNLADVLIVGRGGGSIEDLWAFNDERVAKAIYRSRIPVISAVGHEPDVTISDFVADRSAATPSNAAEIAVPDQQALSNTLRNMSASMASSLQRQLKAARKHLQILSASPTLQSPAVYIDHRRKNLELLKNRMASAESGIVQRHKQSYVRAVSKLEAMSPLKVLLRGYAMAQAEDGQVIKSVSQLQPGDRLRISVSDGVILANVTETKENET